MNVLLLASALLFAPLLLTAQDDPSSARKVELKSGGENSPPHLLHQVDPIPPDLHTAEAFAGIYTLRLLVDETGRPQQVTIVRGISPKMDPAVRTAVEQYSFAPALRDGKPVSTPVQITLRVNLPPVRRIGLLSR